MKLILYILYTLNHFFRLSALHAAGDIPNHGRGLSDVYRVPYKFPVTGFTDRGIDAGALIRGGLHVACRTPADGAGGDTDQIGEFDRTWKGLDGGLFAVTGEGVTYPADMAGLGSLSPGIHRGDFLGIVNHSTTKNREAAGRPGLTQLFTEQAASSQDSYYLKV